MKTGTNLRWVWVVGCLAVAGAGGLFSCDRTPQSKDGSPGRGGRQTPVAPGEEEVSPDSVALQPRPRFNPRAGRVPVTREAYLAALEAVRRYDSLNPKAIVTSNYFSDSLIRVLIGREGSATDKKVSGLRVYRTYTPGQKGFGVLISAVDSTGKEIRNPTKLKDGFIADYLFGTSEEKCPHNCGTLEEQQ